MTKKDEFKRLLIKKDYSLLKLLSELDDLIENNDELLVDLDIIQEIRGQLNEIYMIGRNPS